MTQSQTRSLSKQDLLREIIEAREAEGAVKGKQGSRGKKTLREATEEEGSR